MPVRHETGSRASCPFIAVEALNKQGFESQISNTLFISQFRDHGDFSLATPPVTARARTFLLKTQDCLIRRNSVNRKRIDVDSEE